MGPHIVTQYLANSEAITRVCIQSGHEYPVLYGSALRQHLSYNLPRLVEVITTTRTTDAASQVHVID